MQSQKEGHCVLALNRFFSEVAEQQLFNWVAGRQIVGHPVGPSVIIGKAQALGLLGCGGSIGEGWNRLFKERYPLLTGRTAQCLSLKHNCIVPDD
ncbi:Tc5 transposase DNA-binding domain [Phytophthora infestans]|uniref:Tc5 transposase DNA-binding domain n=1 Tax=Phytophthora infestans TaxID=4787 RepID=A0A8S9UT45_PHYIN|nr:Tc5 transposase DNA-binding domain [Phytophthora infestans]